MFTEEDCYDVITLTGIFWRNAPVMGRSSSYNEFFFPHAITVQIPFDCKKY